MTKIFPLMGEEETAEALETLVEQFQSGEVSCCAIRLYMKDGMYEDITIGGTDEEKQQALAELKNALEKLH